MQNFAVFLSNIQRSDNASERALRVLTTVVLMLSQAVLIDERYAWARPQNGGPHATIRELLDYPTMSLLTGTVCYLGMTLRAWSWLSLAYCAFSLCFVTNYILADSGQSFTRGYYEELIVELAIGLVAISGLAVAAVMFRAWCDGTRPTSWKIIVSMLLIPLWFTSLLLMR